MKTYFSHEGGFTDDSVAIPLQVLHGPSIHRVFDGDKEHINSSTRVIHGDGMDLYQSVHSPSEPLDLRKSTLLAYRTILSHVQKSRKNLLRIWNFIPDILAHENGQERYQIFNAARYQIMGEYGITELPAATGIGSIRNPMVIEVLTTEHPVVHLQNPLQTPAFHYSKKYGVNPPLFSRGTFHHIREPELYVSGTASVRGEDTIYPKDIEKQIETTMENIRTLLSGANLREYDIHHPGFALDDMHSIRVFVKNPEDLPVVRSQVEKYVGSRESTIYLQDDICRKNLLVEIEAVARKSH